MLGLASPVRHCTLPSCTLGSECCSATHYPCWLPVPCVNFHCNASQQVVICTYIDHKQSVLVLKCQIIRWTSLQCTNKSPLIAVK